MAERIGPIVTGQQAVCSSPGYREAREWRRQEKSKAEELEPIKGTHAVRKRAAQQITKRERQEREALPFLSSKEEHLAAELGAYEEDSKKENEMLEKVPPMAFSISSQTAQVLVPSQSCLPGRSLPLRR